MTTREAPPFERFQAPFTDGQSRSIAGKQPVDIEDLPPSPKAIDSICFICGVIDQKVEDAVVALVKRHEAEIRADERSKYQDPAEAFRDGYIEGTMDERIQGETQ